MHGRCGVGAGDGPGHPGGGVAAPVAHTQGVAARAQAIGRVLGEDAELIEAAAWLHDIGYAPRLAVCGFHPLDGARYLRHTAHADEPLCCLVAHHSCAMIEAEERGIAAEMAESPERTDALIYCDMTTSPDGEHVTVDERLSEICSRYGDEHVVSRSIRRASPTICQAVAHIQAQLGN